MEIQLRYRYRFCENAVLEISDNLACGIKILEMRPAAGMSFDPFVGLEALA